MANQHALVLAGGTVGDKRVDIGIDEQGRVAAIDEDLTGSESLDASGCVVIPGLVDLHAHLCQPGFEDAETIMTASRAAALGGYTAVVAMPDTEPTIDNAAMVREVQSLSSSALCQVEIAGAVTLGRAGAQLAPIAEMADLGVRIFTDVAPIADSRIMRRAMEYASSLDVVIAQYANDVSLSAGGHLNEGAVSSRIGIAGAPAAAEQIMVERDLAIARMVAARLHLMNLTTTRSVESVDRARASGTEVTCDVSPHHLTLTDEACATFMPEFKVDPPLRSEADRSGLVDAAQRGSIDAIATDHLPRSPESKEHPFDQASCGMLGLEHALAVVASRAGLELDTIVQHMSTRPAQIAGIANCHGGPVAVGRPANLAVVDMTEEWTVDARQLASLSRNTPYDGWTLTGRVRHTIFNGEAVVVAGKATR